MAFKNFKYLKLSLHVDNVVIHKSCKFSSWNTLYSELCKKWQNLTSMVVNRADFQNQNLTDFVLRYLDFKFCMLVDNIIVNIWIFFIIFKSLKYIFYFFQKNKLHVARLIKSNSLSFMKHYYKCTIGNAVLASMCICSHYLNFFVWIFLHFKIWFFSIRKICTSEPNWISGILEWIYIGDRSWHGSGVEFVKAGMG
jgi:hypothetical protein